MLLVHAKENVFGRFKTPVIRCIEINVYQSMIFGNDLVVVFGHQRPGVDRLYQPSKLYKGSYLCPSIYFFSFIMFLFGVGRAGIILLSFSICFFWTSDI